MLRRAAYRTLTNPWGFRIVCGTVFTVVMTLISEGLHWLYAAHGAWPFVPFFVIMFAIAWHMEKREQRRLGIKRPMFRWQWLFFRS